MNRVITPEIEKYLNLESAVLQTETKDYPVTLALIGNDFLWLIVPASVKAESQNPVLKLRVLSRYTSLSVTFKKIMQKGTHNLILYEYDKTHLPAPVNEKLKFLFTLTGMVQKRKNERIEIDETIEKQIGILQGASFLVDDEWQECILKDISLGGCRFFCLGKLHAIAPAVSSVALRVSFTNPEEDYILPAKVVRKIIMERQGEYISDCALEFPEQVNMHFEQRILSYFHN
ncbi:PilZ domain-containing protein [Treponema sp. HNW]|uniref:PilZ domain-containing protein n=1 Tax=Treponema sp. HNW TaxID=3116654 RepID=UPI003D095D9F